MMMIRKAIMKLVGAARTDCEQPKPQTEEEKMDTNKTYGMFHGRTIESVALPLIASLDSDLCCLLGDERKTEGGRM